MTNPGPYGTIAYPNNAKIKVMIGPRKNNTIFACVGETYSFNKSLRASANA
jgi:hypothetical protein